MHLKIGTRASRLALAQTEIFIKRLQQCVDFSCEIVKIKTTGDKILDRPLYDCGGKALFLKELEEALLSKQIDCAVHSLKDVPGKLPQGLHISAMLKRQQPYDMLICRLAKSIKDLPCEAVVGTSSMRRKAMINKIRPDIKFKNIRGNINTRIDQWQNSDLDAIILAESGLERLDLIDQNYCHRINIDEMVPAVGQGIIAIECRLDDDKITDLCQLVHDQETAIIAGAERGFLEYLEADCDVPLAGFAQIKGNLLIADYMLANNNFSKYVRKQKSISNFAEAYNLGTQAAQELQQMINNS